MDAHWKTLMGTFSNFDINSISYANISDMRRSTLNDELYALTLAGFCREDSATLHSDTVRHLYNADSVWLIEDNEGQGRIIGYMMFDILEHPMGMILYITGIMIDPTYQKQGIFSALIDMLKNHISPDYICARTQNPNVYRTLQAKCIETYPQISSNLPVPTLIHTIAIFVSNRSEMLVTKSKINSSLIFVGVYGEMLYGTKPVNKDFDFYVEFNKYINVTKGDAVLVIGAV